MVRELDGHLPRTSRELRTLPGIGEYTAAAVGSIAFGESVAVVDGNVERVLLRILGLAEDKSAAGRARVYTAAQELVPPARKRKRGERREGGSLKANPPGDHNQAMMELGATLCLPRAPLCLHCPVVALCRTRGEHLTQPRGAQQSRLAAHLLALRKRGLATEVLLERRAAEASLMPGMLELPPLPLAAVEDREPVLRLRHGITNTNYLVQIYSEGARNIAAGSDEEDPLCEEEKALSLEVPEDIGDEDAVVVRAGQSPDEEASLRMFSLLREVPARSSDLEWLPVRRLRELPLTGLTRKCLQRLGLMPVDIRHRQ